VNIVHKVRERRIAHVPREIDQVDIEEEEYIRPTSQNSLFDCMNESKKERIFVQHLLQHKMS
jgi:hypothetical protein